MKYLFVGLFLFSCVLFGAYRSFHLGPLDIYTINERRSYFPRGGRVMENKYMHAFGEGRKQFFDLLKF